MITLDQHQQEEATQENKKNKEKRKNIFTIPSSYDVVAINYRKTSGLL
jgi:hypothetical protein